MTAENLEMHHVVLEDEDAGTRLDIALTRLLPTFSRTRIQALIRDGKVHAPDGTPVTDPKTRAVPGHALTLHVPPPAPASPVAQAIALDVVYEDDALIIINKPAGLVVHPAAGHDDGTLVNALLAHCGASLSGIGGVARPGIVHRIDKDTSGLLVVAKTDTAHRDLQKQFADHGRTGPLERAYVAFSWGAPSLRTGTIDAPLGRDSRNREKIAVVSSERGREAITHYTVETVYGKGLAAKVRCELETGRTHQIRVHMAQIGHPLIADALYAPHMRTKSNVLPEPARIIVNGLNRQALHAAVLGFRHPVSGETMRFESDLPPALQALEDVLSAL